jgi:hypothetical protein
MDRLDTDEVRLLYESVSEVWPKNDLWHQYSKAVIEDYLSKISFDDNSYILNAGSGGNTYGLTYRMHHLDIAENKINKFPEYSVASIESTKLPSNLFTDIICVGSVINYCDAIASVMELSKILNNNGKLILEFESSWGFEHINSSGFKKSAIITDTNYFGDKHKQWIFSPKYIRKILKQAGFSIIHAYCFHYLSGLHYNKHHDENRAAKYTIYDRICRYLPLVKQYSSNVIYTCKKL